MATESDSVARAKTLLHSAESELRKLMAESLAAHRYGDVAQLASIAQRLIGAGSDGTHGPATTANDRHSPTVLSPALPDNDRSLQWSDIARKGNGEYPQFEREGKRLVKIGWSKKDRQVYEHKTPFSAVLAVCDVLRARHGRFVMEQILPIKDREGVDVPSYQAYLVLAWLRQLGLVDRNGNDGYTANTTDLTEELISKKLQTLPAR